MKKLAVLLLLEISILAVLFAFLYRLYPNSVSKIFKGPVVFDSCSTVEEVNYVYYDGYDPLWKQNNKFGLYIYAENDDYIEVARKLVNSKGGDWGYVLIPYNVKDYDYSKWSKVFDRLNKKHLIPIIQLHDVDPDNYKKQTQKAAEFLNEFMWPIKYRYVSVYNEPNDAKFWYNRIDPKEYAEILDFTIDTFKNIDSDFFMLNGAFNVSASNTLTTLDSFEYMRQMNVSVPNVFQKLDGWASHAYPQPNFSGSPYATGRWSIRAYENELSYLKDNLGVTKELPVFITETGWAHAEGKEYNSSFYDVDKISEFFRIAYEEVWLPDERVRAVTPFTIWYKAPFDHFSWVNDDNVRYKHYVEVKDIPKIKGEPPVFKQKTIKVRKCDE